MKKKRFFWALIAILIVSSLALSACGGAAEPADVVVDDMADDDMAEDDMEEDDGE